MDRRSIDTVLYELFRQPVGPVLGTGKHEHLFPTVVRDEVTQHPGLAGFFDRVKPLRHGFRRRVDRRDVDAYRVGQKILGQPANLFRKSRRKKKRLPPGGQQFDNPADVVDKAHIEHPVGLV